MTAETCFSLIGGNYGEAMERMGKKEARIAKYLVKFLDDRCYAELVDAMSSMDYRLEDIAVLLDVWELFTTM